VRFTLDDTPRVLLVGAPAGDDGDAFGQLEGDASVFVLSAPLVDRVLGPLVPDDVLATAILYLDSITIEGEGRRIELRHDGRVFSNDDGPLEADASERLGDAIERLRIRGASGLGGAATTEPRLRVIVQRGNESDPPRRYEILVGAPTGSGDEAEVRRADLPVTLRVRESDLAPFFEAVRR
jgi:hypothetical protein